MRYPRLTLFVVSIFLAVGLYTFGFFEKISFGIGGFGLAGVAVSGFIYSFSFTSAIATASFLHLNNLYNPAFLAVLGGASAMFGDILIFDFLKTGFLDEIKTIFRNLAGRFPFKHFLFLPQSRWFLPLGILIGFIIISSPLPDEIGVAILAFYNLRFRNFAGLTFLLNGLGIYLISSLGYLT
jgi:hypothetical protein